MDQKERPFKQTGDLVPPIYKHLLSFLALVPFWMMRWIHNRVGYSDAFQVKQNHWDEVSASYNLAMVTTLFAGIGVFVVCALWTYQKDHSLRWLCIKFLVGVIYYVIAFIH